ncbi:unnamed protein product [Cylicocyclus nassatus]|uniref:Uncharacterized protein n=1 Tax=Cylicocyclus nassatus TaxID=53992 RepID=A0AA36MF14_CYLNA|nr:unnamed protein product [Cylicocyclus nassatus]
MVSTITPALTKSGATVISSLGMGAEAKRGVGNGTRVSMLSPNKAFSSLVVVRLVSLRRQSFEIFHLYLGYSSNYAICEEKNWLKFSKKNTLGGRKQRLELLKMH